VADKPALGLGCLGGNHQHLVMDGRMDGHSARQAGAEASAMGVTASLTPVGSTLRIPYYPNKFRSHHPIGWGTYWSEPTGSKRVTVMPTQFPAPVLNAEV
jgi:hypothetical protein